MVTLYTLAHRLVARRNITRTGNQREESPPKVQCSDVSTPSNSKITAPHYSSLPPPISLAPPTYLVPTHLSSIYLLSSSIDYTPVYLTFCLPPWLSPVPPSLALVSFSQSPFSYVFNTDLPNFRLLFLPHASLLTLSLPSLSYSTFLPHSFSCIPLPYILSFLSLLHPSLSPPSSVYITPSTPHSFLPLPSITPSVIPLLFSLSHPCPLSFLSLSSLYCLPHA